ncbi:MAG: lamin tail domain-containing protein [Deltaproteobacteria bacterium]|nr:lamin tail domain-containing protein [Deltaproteobacteria bacterium]
MRKTVWVLGLAWMLGCSSAGPPAEEDDFALHRIDVDLFGGCDEVSDDRFGRGFSEWRTEGSDAAVRWTLPDGNAPGMAAPSQGDTASAAPPPADDIVPGGGVPADSPATPEAPPACAPSCTGKQCGPDGCGGLCGACAEDVLCMGGICAFAPPPSPGDLAVNELMIDPAAVPDKTGEWFEVLCLGSQAVDLWGVTVRSGTKEAFEVDRSLPALPGQLLLFARSGDPSLNGGIEPDFAYSGLQLSNESDSITLEFAGELLDSACYSPPSFKIKPGITYGVDPWLADSELNDYPQAWCHAKSKMADGDKGTPGAVNDECP